LNEFVFIHIVTIIPEVTQDYINVFRVVSW
jgi:hypothetical protein